MISRFSSRLCTSLRRFHRSFFLSLAVSSFVALAAQAAEDSSLAAWRAERLAELTAADGWLTLIGRHWLVAGEQTVGAAADNRIVLTKGPSHLGVVTWDEESGKVFLTINPDVRATVSGAEVKGKIPLVDEGEHTTLVEVGSLTLQVIARGERKALRIKDSTAETRTHFAGLNNFPEDSSWRVVAKWEPFLPPRSLSIQNIVGIVSQESVPGKAVFERDGKVYELLPIQYAGEDVLFFVFADQTSGQATYGGGRFLYADIPKDKEVVLDFNRAINPPCAFTPFATCPLPPRENRLPIAVTAGEKAPSDHP